MENKEREYLTLGDLRKCNLPDETPILNLSEGGVFAQDGITITYVEKDSLENDIELDPIEECDLDEYKNENPDCKLIRALIF